MAFAASTTASSRPVFDKWGGARAARRQAHRAPQVESIECTRRLASDCGMCSPVSRPGPRSRERFASPNALGMTSEAVIVVFIVCDGGWKYLSTGAWTDDIDEVAARADEIVYF